MGLGDRVEAWARRFGVPPPQHVRAADEEPERDDGDPAERPAGRRELERFTSRERERD
jgi:hypothetical protein